MWALISGKPACEIADDKPVVAEFLDEERKAESLERISANAPSFIANLII